jgi:uncharacterized protein
MKWIGRRGSSNIEDRRGMGGPIAIGGGIIGVIALVINMFLGGDTSQLENALQQNGQPYQASPQEEEMAQFISVVLADNENVWNSLFSAEGMQYREPTLVLYRDGVQSACGGASSAVGPFYCPADEKIYLDLSFFDELKNRFGASGDFACAYVLSHEVGHHVQNLLGTSGKVSEAMQQTDKAEANKLSVALELQADFFAGVWAHHNQKMINVLEEGDLEEALNAASAVGDDKIQKMSRGEVVPDAFTHGSSQQRMQWFKKGYETGDLRQGNTFAGL